MVDRNSDYFRFLVILIFSLSSALSLGLEGAFSSWGTLMDIGSASNSNSLGIRYIPSFSNVFFKENESTFDLELSINFFTSFPFGKFDRLAQDSSFKPYRLWLRYATDRFESRLGLQKINFGPGRILRSLMWFDRLDPKDPLQFTEGVYALRLRYDFQNNANVWLWGLYGNDDPKGWEMFGTKEKTPEVGGRIQYPLGNAELAITTHHRLVQQEGIAENRIALDGFWDVGVGLWFESSLVHADFDRDEMDYQSFLTLGTDYTFPYGNGLTATVEHLIWSVGGSPFDDQGRIDFSSLSLSYPFGMMDRLSFFSYYNWDSDRPFNFLSWQRTYDRWVIHISGYWTSETNTTSFTGNRSVAMGNQGIQLMVIFNH